MSNQTWQPTATTTTWPASVVLAFGDFGSVCPQHAAVTPMRKRIADAGTAAHKGLGYAPWSSPTG